MLGLANVMQTIPSLALFGFSDSASVHRWNRRAHGVGRPRALFAVANHSQHRDWNTRRRTERPRSRGRDGNDGRPGPATGRAAAGDGCDRYGHSCGNGDRSGSDDDCRGGRRWWTWVFTSFAACGSTTTTCCSPVRCQQRCWRWLRISFWDYSNVDSVLKRSVRSAKPSEVRASARGRRFVRESS